MEGLSLSINEFSGPILADVGMLCRWYLELVKNHFVARLAGRQTDSPATAVCRAWGSVVAYRGRVKDRCLLVEAISHG
jgi:hypothetical protein